MTIKQKFLTIIGLLGAWILVLADGPQVAVAITLPGQTIERTLSGSLETTDAVHASGGLAVENVLVLDAWQMDTLEMVVQQEAGFDYESALWVMTTILNRVDHDAYPDDIWSVITQPGQFEAYGAEHYLRHQGSVTKETKQAILDAVSSPQRVHSFTGFFTDFYAVEKGQAGVSIGGNTYFSWE